MKPKESILKALILSFKPFRKIALLGAILSYPAFCLDLANFYQQVHTQSLQKNYVKFRGRNLLSIDSYHLLNQKEKMAVQYSLVLIHEKIASFIYFNELSGIGISTQRNSHLQFDIKYYETLKDIGIGGEFYAMCVLPFFDKCILLGYESF